MTPIVAQMIATAAPPPGGPHADERGRDELSEWRVTQQFGSGWYVEDASGQCVAVVGQRKVADQIVADHNRAALAQRGPDGALRKALALIEHWHRDAEEYPSWAWQYRDKVYKAEDIIRAALPGDERAAGGEGQRE